LRVVKPFPGGVLVAVMDGLGHGEQAAAAARIAVSALEDHASDSVIALLRLCHEKLLATRGLVMSIASFNGLDDTMTWLGVGNVEGVLVRANATASPARESLVSRGGVAGYQLPPLRAYVLPVMPGDLLLFATDGIQSGFAESMTPTANDTPQHIADRILAEHCKGTDDALVLVARYLGSSQ
jgi:serine/threonine protein phosphatase PrpC